MLRCASKLLTALGDEAGKANFVAPKPKGMWQRTYQRKRFEIEWCENQSDQNFISKFSYLLSAKEREVFQLNRDKVHPSASVLVSYKFSSRANISL
jgi:hypothetical protein